MPSQEYHDIFRFSQLWLFIIICLFGVLFRVSNLEGKVFWVDEVATSIRVSGYTIAEITEELQTKDTILAGDLLSYQFIDRELDLNTTWQALTKSPEHAPLYFLLTRFWSDIWGHSIAKMRGLSVCFSLLIFPALYWLLQELFDRPLISCLGIMLMSVSPFYVAYAQEARPYSLWTVTILLISASFLRAIKTNNKKSWLIYLGSIILGLYTSLLSVFVVLFQGFYLLIFRLTTKRKLIGNYLTINAIALLIFLPWLYIIFTNIATLNNNTSWMRSSLDITALIATWIGTVLLIFADLPLSPDTDSIQMAIVIIVMLLCSLVAFLLLKFWSYFNFTIRRLIYYLIIIAIFSTVIGLFLVRSLIALDLVTLIGGVVAIFILGMVGYSFYYLIRHTPKETWLFLIGLLMSTSLPLLVVDLIFQGQSSGAPRYFIPSQLAMQATVVYTLENKLQFSLQKSLNQQIIARILIAIFLTLGIFSCYRNLNLSPIYLKSRNVHNTAIAKIINRQPEALIVIEPETVGDILSLSHSLLPQIKIKVIEPDNYNWSQDNKNFPFLYILKPSPKLKTQLENNYHIIFQLAYQPQLFTSQQIALDLWSITYR